jgi:hypothetical protein
MPILGASTQYLGINITHCEKKWRYYVLQCCFCQRFFLKTVCMRIKLVAYLNVFANYNVFFMPAEIKMVANKQNQSFTCDFARSSAEETWPDLLKRIKDKLDKRGPLGEDVD